MNRLITVIFILFVSSPLSAQISVEIDRVNCASVGDSANISILVDQPYVPKELGGFDLLIQFDSRLQFISAQPGELFVACGWEYFSSIPEDSNSIRLVAIAELNNGNYHPSCYADSPGELVRLNFHIGGQPNQPDKFYPIWYYWGDCGDNTFSSRDGYSLYISDSVFYHDGYNFLNVTADASFPTPFGAPDECLVDTTTTPIRDINFYTGGIDVTDVYLQAVCPDDITVNAEQGLCSAVVTFEVDASESCPDVEIVSTPASGSIFPLGTTQVLNVVTDAFGTSDFCYFNVTVIDSEPPEVICREDTTLYNVPGEWWAQVDFSSSATDYCSDVDLIISPPSGTHFALGTTDVVTVGTDSSGNSDTCVFTVTVLDNESPQLSCPPVIELENEPGLCGATANYTVTANDNSMQVTVTTVPPSGSFFPVGTTLVVSEAIDPSGNIDSCFFDIIITDTEKPILNCPPDITVSNDPGQCGAIVSYELTSTDNCPEPSISTDYPSGTFFPIGTTLVTAVATDSFGNADTCTFTVTVQDTEPPTINCPTDIIEENDPGECGATIEFSIDASDNCPDYTITTTPSSGSFFPVGITIVLSEVTDISGNSVECSFVIEVIDNEAPVITQLEDIIVVSDSGYYGAVVNYNPTVEDNCQLSSFTVDPPSGTYVEIGTTEVYIDAVDINGNVDSSLFMVTVILQDEDLDGVADFEDNCVSISNPEQFDTNNDGIGDACCCNNLRGNIDGSPEVYPNESGIDIADIVYFVNFAFGTPSGPSPPCPKEADVDNSGTQDIADIVYMVTYSFGSPQGPAPYGCE